MLRSRLFLQILFVGFPFDRAQQHGRRAAQLSARTEASEFGPVMQAYLGYLRNEQEVVDDRISRREINVNYYRRNSNRIRALRRWQFVWSLKAAMTMCLNLKP